MELSRLWLVAAVVSWLTLVSAVRPAAADQVQPLPTVVYVEGDEGDKVREEITRALPPNATVVSSDKLADALAKKKIKGHLGRALASARERPTLIRAARSGASAAGAEVSVLADIRAAKDKSQTVRLLVVSGPKGKPTPIEPITLPANEASAARVNRIRKAFSVTEDSAPEPAAVSTTTPAPDTTKTSPEPSESVASKADVATPETPLATADLLRFSLGAEATLRRFRYNQSLSPDLRSYDITAAPSLYVGAELYPFAYSKAGVMRHVGLTANFAQGIGISSQRSDNTTVSTTFQRWRLGLRGRIPLGRGDRPGEIGLEGSYGRWRYDFANDGGVADGYPGVRYGLLRFGVDARLPAGPIFLLAGAGGSLTSESGAISTLFPHASVGSVDLRLGASIPLGASFEIRAWVDYLRAFFALKPEVGDRFVAGGALDQYATLHLDALFHL